MSSDTSKARAVRTAKANEYAENIYPRIRTARKLGISMYRIAIGLNDRLDQWPTPTGRGKWSTVQVKRIVDRIENLKLK